MHIPKVDLTDAAEAYGLRWVPQVVHNMDDELGEILRGWTHASYSPSDYQIHVYSDLFQAPDEYDEMRFVKAGAGRLSYPDSAKFVLAHELWHARQEQDNGKDAETLEAHLINAGLVDHDSAQSEVDADKHAAKVYKLVKIGD